MIRQVTKTEISRWQPDSEAGLRLCGQFAAYGDVRTMFRFYEDDEGGRLSIVNGVATFAAGEDTREMRLFLTMSPDVCAVRTDKQTAVLLANEWRVPVRAHIWMQAEQVSQPVIVPEDAPLREIYPLLRDVFGEDIGPFDEWYADVHHRCRRDLCRAVGVWQNESLCSCAMTVCECPQAAMIGAVATLPSQRGKGYAGACVAFLTRLLLQQNKRVTISPKNDGACRLYTRIGFMPCGDWGEVRR